MTCALSRFNGKAVSLEGFDRSLFSVIDRAPHPVGLEDWKKNAAQAPKVFMV